MAKITKIRKYATDRTIIMCISRKRCLTIVYAVSNKNISVYMGAKDTNILIWNNATGKKIVPIIREYIQSIPIVISLNCCFSTETAFAILLNNTNTAPKLVERANKPNGIKPNPGVGTGLLFTISISVKANGDTAMDIMQKLVMSNMESELFFIRILSLGRVSASRKKSIFIGVAKKILSRISHKDSSGV